MPPSWLPAIETPFLSASPFEGRSLPHHLEALPATKVGSLVLVGKDPVARAIALGAARLAYPQIGLTEVAGVAEAEAREPSPHTEILILLRPSPADVERATHARDPRGLPRWAVVIFGENRSVAAAQTVPPEDWSPRLGAQALSCATALHELACDNERLRGDLRTVGRRINHDLRTPLNCISTLSDGWRTPSSGPASSGMPLAQTLLAAVDEVAVLVERVSFVLKATADPPPRQPVTMGRVVWTALQRRESHMQRQGATVAQPDSWPPVEGVASWLEVIWGNFLDNSLKHGGPAPRIELGWADAGRELRFWIRDSGPGVAGEKLTQLFEPFDRLHEIHAPSGLGLPLVQRLVELQGGRCGYESLADGGLFFFTLPAA